jgi:hypothetical protein
MSNFGEVAIRNQAATTVAEVNQEGRLDVTDLNSIQLEIIRGNTYSSSVYKDMANNEEFDIVVRATNNPSTAIQFAVSAIYQCQMDFYEDTIESGGSPLPIMNNSRTEAAANPPSTVIVSSPTITGTGDFLMSKRIGLSGSGNDIVSGSIGNAYPMSLKPNVSYLLRLTSLAASNQVNFDAFFIESDEQP